MKDLQFIAGRWRSGSGPPLSILNPADGQILSTYAGVNETDLSHAATSAHDGFLEWSRLSPWHRGTVITRIADEVRKRRGEIAHSITREQGKPLREALAEADRAADFMEWGACLARSIGGQLIPGRQSTVIQRVEQVPLGVACLMTPWNFPAVLIAKKLSAALAAGCACIIKPSEETPGSAVHIVEACLAAGLPELAITLVVGPPELISDVLIPHPLVRKISFTGSTAVGKLIARKAADNIKPTTLELGGHAPVVVCGDVDVPKVAAFITTRKFYNAGQACIAPTRFIIESNIYHDFVDALASEASFINCGDGMEATTQMGPLANLRRVAAIDTLVKQAVSAGAEVCAGGARREGMGFFYLPTVLRNTPDSAHLLRIEPFGPVAPTLPFDTLDEAIDLANNLPYGLAAYAFTNNPSSQHKLGRNLEAGMIGINDCPTHLPELPMGGWKDSGIGVEGGVESVRGYLQGRLVCVSPTLGPLT